MACCITTLSRNISFIIAYFFSQLLRSMILLFPCHTKPVVRAIEVSHAAWKDEFRRNLRSNCWRFFHFIILFGLVTQANENHCETPGLKPGERHPDMFERGSRKLWRRVASLSSTQHCWKDESLSTEDWNYCMSYRCYDIRHHSGRYSVIQYIMSLLHVVSILLLWSMFSAYISRAVTKTIVVKTCESARLQPPTSY